MKGLVVAVAALCLVGTAPAAGQDVQWEEIEIDGGGIEFRLRNDDGASIILVCNLAGVVTGFEFPEPLDNPQRATVRGIPGEQQNVAVSVVNDRIVRVDGGGVEVTVRLLRASARLYVRVAGEAQTFSISGSAHVVSRCLERQDAAIPDPTRRF